MWFKNDCARIILFLDAALDEAYSLFIANERGRIFDRWMAPSDFTNGDVHILGQQL
ncbi:hypothetical protein D9M68_808120 [compost metagenome]